MKIKIFLLMLCAAMGWAQAARAQEKSARQLEALARIAQPGSTADWLDLREDAVFSERDFFEKTRTALGLSPDDEMRPLRSESDELDMTHHRYEQFHQGLRVYGSQYILHEREGRIVSANGRLISPKNWPAAEPAKSEQETLPLALKAVPSEHYLWKDEAAKSDLKNRENHPESLEAPKGELLWLKPSEGSRLVLAWRFDVLTTDGLSERVFIDAESGEILKRVPLDIHCNPTSAATIWNGTQNISTDKPGSNFILLNDCQSPNVHVFNSNDSVSLAFATEYTSGDNAWTGQNDAIQTFWGLDQARIYYQNTHGRSSYDGGGADMIAYQQAGFKRANGTTYWSNASWSGSQHVLRFGDNGTATFNDDWNTTDIVGHEMTHGVTEFSAGLDYTGESGALNESFSDIFGERVEEFSEGAMDWLVGNDRGAIRSFISPGTFGDPDTYQGTNWTSTGGTCDGTNDFCGVHTNSGVQNHWFYLLAQGGTETNDNGDLYTIQGIGTASAAAIAYRSLTNYLTSSSGYADAKNGAIHAAIDLFGNCSNEVLQCARAWNAVGVNSTDLFGYDIQVDCPTLDLVHGLGITANYVAFNDIRSDCDITANGTLVSFQAGRAVTLKPGFDSGDSFHAFIVPCGAPKPGHITGGNGGGKTEEREHIAAAPTGSLEVAPNPFADELKVQFMLSDPAAVSLQLVDASGKTVRQLLDGRVMTEGGHAETFDTQAWPPGLYFLEMRTPMSHETRKVIKAGN